MKTTTKTYVRKFYTGYPLSIAGGDHPVTKTFMYPYPEELVQLALDHVTQQDEGYELVIETVSGISSAELNAMVATGLRRHETARLAAERADDEHEYARLAEKLGKN